MLDRHDAAAAAAELQRILIDTPQLDEFLDEVAMLAADTIVPPGSCGITIIDGMRSTTVASSDERAALADEAQYEAGFGPCLHSADISEIVIIDDMATDQRWPKFRMLAIANGLRSSMSLPLTLGDGIGGALNLYAESPYVFGEAEQKSATRFTAEVSRAITLALRMANQVRMTAQLESALASRSVIDQAIGIVMAQNTCDPGKAFAIIRTASHNRNVKLREVARLIVEAVGGPSPVVAPPFRPDSARR